VLSVLFRGLARCDLVLGLWFSLTSLDFFSSSCKCIVLNRSGNHDAMFLSACFVTWVM
jgi:hypothetical protein